MTEIENARALNGRILRLARAHDHAELLELDADPNTERLLDLLEGGLADAARTHLKGARAWRRRKEEANLRRLEEARAALNAFDLVRARSLLHRIEEDFLSPEVVGRRDALLIELAARSMEHEHLQAVATDVVDEHTPRWRRWWVRRRRATSQPDG